MSIRRDATGQVILPPSGDPRIQEPRRIAGIVVGSVALGGAGWSLPEPIDEERAIRTIHAAVDTGIRLIDTACAYTTRDIDSHNERLIGKAVRTLKSDVLVATKGGHERRGDSFPIDGHPATIRRHCEASLRALGLDCIALYQLHHPDPRVPLSETMGASPTFSKRERSPISASPMWGSTRSRRPAGWQRS